MFAIVALQRKPIYASAQLRNKMPKSSRNLFSELSSNIYVQSLDYSNQTQSMSSERECWIKTSIDALRRVLAILRHLLASDLNDIGTIEISEIVRFFLHSINFSLTCVIFNTWNMTRQPKRLCGRKTETVS